ANAIKPFTAVNLFKRPPSTRPSPPGRRRIVCRVPENTHVGIFRTILRETERRHCYSLSLGERVRVRASGKLTFRQLSTFASIVTLALSNREMGQPALAALAIWSTWFLSAPGTFTVTSRCDSVTVQPASVLSKVIVAVALINSALNPSLPSSAENAMAKHPACAAPINSSGFVPMPDSKRVLNEYCVSLRTPLSVEMLPLPDLRSPRQTADALRFINSFRGGDTNAG